MYLKLIEPRFCYFVAFIQIMQQNCVSLLNRFVAEKIVYKILTPDVRKFKLCHTIVVVNLILQYL